LPPPEPQAMAELMVVVGKSRDERIARLVETFRVIGSPPPLFDEDRVRARVTRSYDRCFHPAGLGRQLLAVLNTPGRATQLASLLTPTLVIHGDRDPLVPLACGQATAAAIPHARLLVLPGMGHDLPSAHWPQIVSAITEQTQSAATPPPKPFSYTDL
jgi:pimeloyl-ACP methyl ester carboxylesterase